MATSLRLAFCLVLSALFLSSAQALDFANSTGTAVVPAVVLDNESAFGVCVYPTSGTYSFLNRLLYYCTLVFSLFSRAHLWLVAGALAAALTYSGAAAIHACLLAWRGPNPFIENDNWALITILTSACLITVPLLNWSGTLRRLGAKAASVRDKKGTFTQSDVGTRTIVVYWAFLVLLGLICVWEQYRYGDGETNMEYPDMEKVMCRPGTNSSMFISPNGTTHRRAIDQQFIKDNGCTNPCDQIDIPALFRQQSELQLLDHSQALLWNYTLPGAKYQKLEKLQTAENRLLTLSVWILPFVLLQGFITVCFGRRDPREIRDLIYINIFMERPLSQKRYLLVAQDWTARTLAFLSYIIAAATVVVCPPLFVLSIAAQEYNSWVEVPDSETLSNVGQWEPWAVAAQAIIAALIAAYHDTIISLCVISCRRTKQKCFRRHLRGKERNPSSTSDSARADREAGVKNDFHATISSTSTSQRPSPCPLQDTKAKRDLLHKIRYRLYLLYKLCAHPLNQNDQGIGDEVMNFFRWCRDPQAISRMVIRHPIRPRDARDVKNLVGEQGGPTGDVRGRLDSGFFRGASMERLRTAR